MRDTIITGARSISGEKAIITPLADQARSRRTFPLDRQDSAQSQPGQPLSGQQDKQTSPEAGFHNPDLTAVEAGLSRVNGMSAASLNRVVVPPSDQYEIYVEAPQTPLSLVKTGGRKMIEMLDRTAMRPFAQLFANSWIAIRDRNIAADQKIEIGREGDIWFSRQGDTCLTHTKISWSALPKRVLYDIRDDFFYRYGPTANDTVVSIGSGCGVDVLACALYMERRGHVHAVEAHPRTFKALELCCRLNKLPNVSTYQYAITATNRMVHVEDGKDSLSN